MGKSPPLGNSSNPDYTLHQEARSLNSLIESLFLLIISEYRVSAISLALVSRQRKSFLLHSFFGNRIALSIIFSEKNDVLTQATNRSQTVYRPDLGKLLAAASLWGDKPILSDCIIPLTAAGECLGTLNVGSHQANGFSGETRQDLQRMAAVIALALQSAQAAELDDYRLLRSLVSISPNLIVFKDKNFAFRLVNQAFCRYFGKSEEEILGKTDYDFFPPEKAAKYRRDDQKVLASGQRYEGDEHACSLIGENWLHVTKIPVPDGENGFQGILCVAQDVTERKRLERELLDANAKLEERVAKRTAALEVSNDKLRREVEERQTMLAELEKKSKEFEELNVALRILMEQGSKAKQEVEANITSNIDSMIMPALDQLLRKLAGTREKEAVLQIKRDVEQLTSSFAADLVSKGYNFSPRELQIANLVRQGNTNKEIASLLNLSIGTIQLYRDKIRTKLGIKKKRVNLVSFLRSRPKIR